MHEDQCDSEVALGKFHAWVGDKAYDALMFANRWFNRVRSWRNGHYWSLAGYIKKHVKGPIRAVVRYKHAAIKRARDLELDGVICGLIHQPESYMLGEIHYVNDGDWIENCYALVEENEANLNLVDWVFYTKDKTVSELDLGRFGATTRAA